MSLRNCARDRSSRITAEENERAPAVLQESRGRSRPHALAAPANAALLARLAREVEARALARAAHVQRPVAMGGARPALAIQDVRARELAVGLRVRLAQHDLARVGERDERAPHQDAVARAEDVLPPARPARRVLDALQRSLAVLLEAEHAVEVAVLLDGRAPVVDQLVRRAPEELRGDLRALLLDAPRRRADSLAGRAVDHVAGDHR